LRKYHTGYMVDDWEQWLSPSFKGSGWNVTLSKPKPIRNKKLRFTGPPSSEIIINTLTFRGAQNALHLINSAYLLDSGYILLAGREIVKPGDENEIQSIFGNDIPIAEWSKRISTDRLPQACLIAAKASHIKSNQYALIKYKLSSQLHSQHILDLDPAFSNKHLGVSPYIVDHVNLGYSIVLSYSVIEELGLEIRATSTTPSIINGNWNPKVKNNLLERLKQAGINLSETVPWALRGRPTRIEIAKELPSKGRCPWAKGAYLRDCELEVIDAIRTASFIRSKGGTET
jgi:hypothetical protein